MVEYGYIKDGSVAPSNLLIPEPPLPATPAASTLPPSPSPSRVQQELS